MNVGAMQIASITLSAVEHTSEDGGPKRWGFTPVLEFAEHSRLGARDVESFDAGQGLVVSL